MADEDLSTYEGVTAALGAEAAKPPMPINAQGIATPAPGKTGEDYLNPSKVSALRDLVTTLKPKAAAQPNPETARHNAATEGYQGQMAELAKQHLGLSTLTYQLQAQNDSDLAQYRKDTLKYKDNAAQLNQLKFDFQQRQADRRAQLTAAQNAYKDNYTVLGDAVRQADARASSAVTYGDNAIKTTLDQGSNLGMAPGRGEAMGNMLGAMLQAGPAIASMFGGAPIDMSNVPIPPIGGLPGATDTPAAAGAPSPLGTPATPNQREDRPGAGNAMMMFNPNSAPAGAGGKPPGSGNPMDYVNDPDVNSISDAMAKAGLIPAMSGQNGQ